MRIVRIFRSALIVSLTMMILSGCAKGSPPAADATPEHPTQSSPISETGQAPPQVEKTQTPAPTPTPTPTSERESPDFRSAKWGDTAETVRSFESASFIDTVDGNLAYDGTVAGLAAHIFFRIDPDYGFYTGTYNLTVPHTSGTGYITDYETLKAAVSEKYGPPESDDIIPISSLADYADEGQKVLLGYVGYLTTWSTETCLIKLAMMSDNYKVSTILQYSTPDFTPPPNTDGV